MVVLGWDELGLSYKSCRTSLSQILFWAQLYNVVFNNPYMPSPAQQVNNKTARRSLCCLLGSWNPFENWSEWVSEWDQVKNTLLSLRFPLSLSLSLSHKTKRKEIMTSLTELDDDTVRTMSIGAVFSDFVSLLLLRSPLTLAIDSKLEPCFLINCYRLGR